MKIIFVIKSLHSAGGTERITTLIANELSKKGYEVGIVSIVQKNKPFFELAEKVCIHYIAKRGEQSIVSKLSRFNRLKKMFASEQPDIIVQAIAEKSFSVSYAARNYKLITWEHFNLSFKSSILHLLSRIIAVKFSKAIVTLTKQDADNYKKLLKAKNVVAIPNPCPIKITEKSSLMSKNVIAIGRFQNQKGFDLLLSAWSKVRSKDAGWKLTIIGSGSREKQLRNIIKKLNINHSVQLLPSTNDVVSVYKQAAIYVMSSRYEGLPLVLIEAMSMGIPIISFDCDTGPRDIIVHNSTGILVPPLDVENLALEIDRLINDEPKRLLFAKNAIVRSKDFEIEPIVSVWIDFLSSNK